MSTVLILSMCGVTIIWWPTRDPKFWPGYLHLSPGHGTRQDIRDRRVDEVGDWFLQTQEYRNWFGGIHGGESHGAALFSYGGPGVGKTFIR